MTAQVHENLIYEGEEMSMACSPPIPEWHSRMQVMLDEECDLNTIIFSTGCCRAYIGTWSIVDNRFFLVRLEGKYRLVGDEPLFADWFSGVLRIPKGKLLEYVHFGFESVYEQELLIEIKKGIVTRTWNRY